MLQNIQSEGFSIYTNEIVDKEEFSKLYKNEEILTKFETIVTTSSHHPFATFLAKPRRTVGINAGKIIVLRAVKEGKKFEFVCKIGKWGKFSIPKEVIEVLDIKNHGKMTFEIIKESEKLENAEEEPIDLSNIKGSNIIYRRCDLITVFKEYRTPLTLPRFIKISPELVELFFLIHGDGHYQYKLYFVNKNIELHRFVIKQFESILKVPKDLWRARVLFNNPAEPEVARKYWEEELKLKEKQFYPTISRCTLNTSDKGNLRIVIETPVISDLFKYIFEEIQQSEDYYIPALNGLLCAEGGAGKSKQGIHRITLSFSQKEKEMFASILNKAGLLNLTKVSQNSRFCIEGWENLYSFFKLFFENKAIPFDIHSQRCKNALEGFLNHSFTQTMSRYLNILNEKEAFTVKEVIDKTGFLPNSILSTLRRPQYSKFIGITGKGINRNPFIFSITPEGEDFIALIKNIQEVYNEKCRSK